MNQEEQSQFKMHPPLTVREIEVLKYLAEGYSNKEISSLMFVSSNTVKTHIKNIYSKLQINRRVHALIKAQELNITLKST